MFCSEWHVVVGQRGCDRGVQAYLQGVLEDAPTKGAWMDGVKAIEPACDLVEGPRAAQELGDSAEPYGACIFSVSANAFLLTPSQAHHCIQVDRSCRKV